MNKLIYPVLVGLGILCVAQNVQQKKHEEIAPVVLYQAKTFNLESIPFLSASQKQQHYKLYEGYVKKLNEIRSKLPKALREAGITYSEYRGLKIAETFALNGVLLHEYYFENFMHGADTEPQEKMLALIIASFGSLETFLQDLRAAALCARGWVLTGYTLADGRVYNYVLDAHNETVPALTIPLLVIDVYEHAYMIDFGINRADYVSLLLNNINWHTLEDRVRALE